VDGVNEGVVEAGLAETRIDLETLFRAQYCRIARVISGVIRDPARAEELAVEVFLKWERTQKAHGEGAEGWLYRAAVRVALNELRRKTLRGRYEHLPGLVTAGKFGASTPHEIYSAQEERQRVQVVLGAIEPRQAEILLLRCSDLSYQELALTLNLNPASVGTLLSRALRAFRKEFIRRYGRERYERE
jgi:RNA polymerase sigma-70 factor (ECF subfamily)